MYINFVNEENKNFYISCWLLLITFLVALIIVIGGLTRLTDSGLSITQWNLLSGIFPPLNSGDWENLFNLYKNIPEYKLLNSSMTVDEFKYIFWWEYIHRMLGRLIGLLYIIPLLYFTFKRILIREKIISLYLIFFLICLQGFVGWFMVKSGLTERTDVSHYRLSIHLLLAFIIFISLFWNYLNLNFSSEIKKFKKIPYNIPFLFLLLILIQILTGALVSGLDAGQIYQSWPLMNGSYFPDDSSFKELISKDTFNTPSQVQFLHRNIAYIIFFLFIYILITIFKNSEYVYLRKISLIVLFFLLLQIFLGVLTVLSGAQIVLASMHQIGSIFLITSSLILAFKNSKTN